MIRVLYAKEMLNAMIGARLVFYRAYLAIWNVLTIWHGTKSICFVFQVPDILIV